MPKLPLVKGVLDYVKKGNTLFCMPGHKGGKGFLSTEPGKKFYEMLIKTDITEVDGLDNLHHAEGIINEAQNMLSSFYGSKKSYFLVNGSTSGNLAMIFSCFNEGDKVIVERNCHRSVLNGIIMRKLNPVYIKNKIHKKYNAPLSIEGEHFIETIRANEDAKGIIITYPNYYGICCDLNVIISEAHKRGMKVLVDSAHGAHFGVHEALPESAVSLGSDYVVTSSHKTLPSFTQTAYLHIGENVDIGKVDFYVSAFLSTSPSYMLMCSMDYARYYLQEYGHEDYGKLISMLNIYRQRINKLKGFHVIGAEDSDAYNIDVTRYVLNVEKGFSAFKLYDYLRSRNLQPEFCDSSNVILIFSTFTTEAEIKALYEALRCCNLDELKNYDINIKDISIPNKRMLPYEAIQKEKKNIPFYSAENKVCAEAVVPYPPGIPVILPGEVIERSTIDFINYYLRQKVTMLGVKNGEIQIIND